LKSSSHLPFTMSSAYRATVRELLPDPREQPADELPVSQMNTGFLTAQVWIDKDMRHVWLAHDCGLKRMTVMLPDTWEADGGGKVLPSINCTACGLHYFGELERPPRDWEQP